MKNSSRDAKDTPTVAAEPAVSAEPATQSTVTPEAAAPAAQADATTPSGAPPEATIADLRAQVADLTDRYLRARAEMDNYRKRVQREMSDLRDHVKSAVLGDVLTVFDHMQFALAHADQNADAAALRQGMDLICSEFRRALDNLGVQPFDAVGKPFDPTAHEAVSQEPSADMPEGHVLRQWKSGYRLGERLLRPATVVVSTGPAPAPAATPDTEPQK